MQKVKYSCGHTETLNLKGTSYEIERMKQYYKLSGKCQKCKERDKNNKKNEKNEKGCYAIEMPYSEYKERYIDCKKKAGSYKKEEKLITVYVPKNRTLIKETVKEIMDLTKCGEGSARKLVEDYFNVPEEEIEDFVKKEKEEIKNISNPYESEKVIEERKKACSEVIEIIVNARKRKE